jgi:hypothetical protein
MTKRPYSPADIIAELESAHSAGEIAVFVEAFGPTIKAALVACEARSIMGDQMIPDDVLEAMAEAMLDPPLRDRAITTSSSGNVERKKILTRSLAAARALGWRLRDE